MSILNKEHEREEDLPERKKSTSDLTENKEEEDDVVSISGT